MESGPSVLAVFTGVGISDFRFVPAPAVVVACDTEAVIVWEAVGLVLVAVLEFGELLHAAATKPMAIAAADAT
jgi:hypothetical protein